MAIEAYTRLSQLSFLSVKDEPILMSLEDYETARSYAKAKQKLEIVKLIAAVASCAFWLFSGLWYLSSFIELNTLVNQTLFVVVFIVINYFIFLPFELFGQFVLDKNFGFSNMTVKLYIQDTVKTSLIFFIIATPIIYAMLWIISTFATWWLWCFVLLFTIVLLANWLVPVVFFPLFNKFEPIQDDNLENDIKNLAHKSSFNIFKVFKVDASKRDKRLNAYFIGFGHSKRVVLFDTLIQKLSKNEILAVLAHEFGHMKNKDLFKMLFASAATLFVLCFVFGNLQINGLSGYPVSVIIEFLLFGGAISLMLAPITNFISRKNEFAADKYASDMGYKQDLMTALQKLVEENKYFPKASELYKLFHQTHPSPIERISKLESR